MKKKISLAKALQVKNRLAGRLQRMQEQVRLYNSIQSGTQQIDVNAAYNECKRLSDYLVDLKTQIQEANQPISRHIFAIAETRSWVAFLTTIPTKHGEYKEYHLEQPVKYVAELRKEPIDEYVDINEAHIDRLQDEINTHNAKTLIEVDAEVLELGKLKKKKG